MKWFVIYTKPNFEIKVSNALNYMGIKAYCPTYKKVVQYSDRKKGRKTTFTVICISLYKRKERDMVFSIPGVIRYVFWLGKPAEVYEKEVEALKNSLKGIIDSFSLMKLNKGSNYVIQNGPLKGREGKVLSTDKNKLKLELTGLGLLVSLTIY